MFVMSAIHVSAETDSIANDSEVYMGLWLTEINDEAIYLLIKKPDRTLFLQGPYR